mmetsp:Transcript_66050/g.214848  ORF Transcript_66050/g.214848 Transcript_66050/m.214848 type:complete len:480 (-) Transcript_66050:385-1824(-)
MARFSPRQFAVTIVVASLFDVVAARCSRQAADSSSTCEAGLLSQPPSLLQRRSELHQESSSLDADSETCCSAMGEWPHVKNGVHCSDCTALVFTAPFDGRCDAYCESFGHVCVGAAEDAADDCAVKWFTRCDWKIRSTSDMLCKCALPASSCSAAAPQQAGASDSGQRIQVKERQILVDGKPIHLKGVAWNPIKKGGTHPSGLNFAEAVERDADLLAKAGVNAVRTYSPITDTKVLDVLWAHGIWVLNSVYNNGRAPSDSVVSKLLMVKHHPAILMWTIGNEWNYNGLYVGMGLWDAASKLQEVASVIKQFDQEHPVACVYGELQSLREVEAKMPSVDVWGVNAYRGISFGSLFDSYAATSSKPLFLGEYGADAFNTKIGREDQESQAVATKALTQEIADHSSVNGGVCLGGFVFELADEWWKDDSGSAWEHDKGGHAPGSGPYPDMTFNEEWWGLVDIDRNPRRALSALGEVAIPSAR